MVINIYIYKYTIYGNKYIYIIYIYYIYIYTIYGNHKKISRIHSESS